jgi:hypothetical protein
MKHLKILGLAAVAAMAVMAFLGASSASATVLCKIFKQPCPKAEVFPAKTKIKATLRAKTSLEIKDVHETLDTCTGSTIEGLTGNAGGGKGVAVEGTNETETFTGCTHTVTVLEKGKFEVRYIGPTTDGTWVFSNDNVTVEDLGVTCSYGSGTEDEVGIFESDETTEFAELDFVEAELTKIAGSFLCPPTVFFAGEYWITEPKLVFTKQEST